MSERSSPPWFAWTALASVTLVLVGVYWDISWHMSIGRDSFWTPAHIAIQLGGILGGASGAVLVFATTFSKKSALRDASIGVLGFRGPFGAFLAAWGAATMVVSAPFDDWWHSAYGLDVKILSPPHAVLTLGILGVAVGGVVLVVAAMNRMTGAARDRLAWILLAIASALLALTMISILEHTSRSNLHNGDAYRFVAIIAPVVLVGFSRVVPLRWAATAIAGAYTVAMALGVWLMPLFPAEPKLGPVYQPITHYVPLEFPLALIAPAIAIDLVRARLASWPRWRLAIVLGVAFVASFVAVEWPLAEFLQSDAARNALFGGDYFAYFTQPDWYEPRHEFFPDRAIASGLAQAVAIAIASAGVGLVVGDAMRRVKR
jgi:hypothetical protein